MNNGLGLRTVLWVSHCEHKCSNCQNTQTWDKNGGIPFDEKAKEELFDDLSDENIQGITFSGGDPLSTLNRNEILSLAKEIKEIFPNKDIWCYTGYKWNDVKNLKGIEYLDVLVDGKFEEGLSVPSPKWCGSQNQKILNVQESLKQGKVILYAE
jgi:anaerobic ribonucleoside-triphosphate reductase activating protein